MYLEDPQPRMPNPIYSYQETGLGTMYCQICGEHMDPEQGDEVGEFGLPEGQTGPNGEVSIVTHGQCGLDHNLTMA